MRVSAKAKAEAFSFGILLKGGEILRKWYMKPVGEMAGTMGEMIALRATISGEIKLDDVPVAPWAALDEIKKGDTDPYEVVMEVPAGKSKRGWNYKPEALQAIVNEVMQEGLPGYLGHQKAEDIETEFRIPVTHWVGAKWDPKAEVKDKQGKVVATGAAYFRGVVDKSQPDLKRWIRAKTVRQVSIFGYPKLKRVAGETEVVGYKPLSIDWTPMNRAGMPTRLVASGEMQEDVTGEFDDSYEDLKEILRAAIKEVLKDGYLWVYKTYDDKVVVEHESNGASKLYEYSYAIVDDKVVLGEKIEVKKIESFEPVGEIFGGGQEVTWKEYLAKIKALIQSGEVTVQQVAGEMGWTAQQMARALDENWLNQVTGEMSAMGEIKKVVTGDNPAQAITNTFATLDKVKTALGVTGEMDIVAVATEAGKAAGELKKAQQTTLVDGVLKEKVSGEMAQALVRKMLAVPEAATKEIVAGEIDKILTDETIKAALSQAHLDRPLHVGGGSGGGELKYTRKKSVSI